MKKDNTATIILLSLIIALTTFSEKAKAGASNGLGLCESIIIPSLLPMLIITSTIIKSRCARVIEQIFGKATERVLRLPSCATGAIIFGLIGGYPTGAILTQHLHENGKISDNDAKRIMSFNMCGGIAFIITAVGTIFLQSTKYGVVLFVSNILSSLIIAIATAIKKPMPSKSYTTPHYLPLTDAMVEAVEGSARAIINMSAYIVLFSAIASIFPIPPMLNPAIEITNGIICKDYNLPLEYISFFLSFGGLCIHFQLVGMLKKMNISYTYFLVTRLISALLSFAITKAYLFIFPQTDEVFSNLAQRTTAISQVNTGLSIVMLLGCVVIIFDIENKKYKLI